MKSELLEIPGMTEEQAELFEAVGVVRKIELRDFDVEQLHVELTDANGFLQICEKTPDLRRLEEWQSLVTDLDKDDEQPVAPIKAVPKKAVTEPKINENAAGSPLAVPEEKPDAAKWSMALPVPVAQMVRSGLEIEAIPAARVVAVPVKAKEASSESAVVPASGTQPISQAATNQKSLPANFAKRDRGLRTTVLPETNQGKIERSRGFIRGVLYPRVGDLVAGALSTIFMFVFFPLAVASAIMMIYSPNPWLMVAPLCLLISGLLYLVFGLRPRCRICGQGVFASKSCHRHVKAHHIPIIGYILPTALQMLIFRWFRCIYCGTSIRLKE